MDFGMQDTYLEINTCEGKAAEAELRRAKRQTGLTARYSSLKQVSPTREFCVRLKYPDVAQSFASCPYKIVTGEAALCS